MLVGGVVDDQLGDYPQAALVGLPDELFEFAQRAVCRIHLLIV